MEVACRLALERQERVTHAPGAAARGGIGGGRWMLTPLTPALVMVETTDLVFAVDSIPAIFAVTADPFLVFTSNVFAILGLRSLYFALAGVMDRLVSSMIASTFARTKTVDELKQRRTVERGDDQAACAQQSRQQG